MHRNQCRATGNKKKQGSMVHLKEHNSSPELEHKASMKCQVEFTITILRKLNVMKEYIEKNQVNEEINEWQEWKYHWDINH